MAIENAKTLNVRIRNKYDSYENWAKSSIVLEAGEIAIAYTTVNVEVGNGKIEQHPELLMKVGDGTKTFSALPWLSAKAADVATWAKAANKPSYEAGEITGIDSYIANYVNEQMGISVDTDTQYQIVKVDDYNYKLQSKGKTDSAWADVANSVIVIPNDTAAIEALEELVGDTKVATQITNAITELDLANTYETKGEAAKVQTALNEYKTSNDAAVKKVSDDLAGEIARAGAAEKANADAIAAIKDGTTIDSFADVETALAGKETSGAAAQALADAKTYADGKDDAIAKAKKAGDDAQAAADAAQGEIDALEAKVGTVPEGSTVMGIITNIQENAYDDTEIRGLIGDNADAISALETQVGEKPVAEQISTAIANEKIAETYATKAEAQGYANAKDSAIAEAKKAGTDAAAALGEYKTTNDAAVQANADAIEAVEASIGTVTEGKTVVEMIEAAQEAATYDDTALAGRVTAVEGDIATLNGDGDGSIKKAIDAAFDDFATKVSDDTVVNTYKELIDYAAENGAEVTTLIGKVSALETTVGGTDAEGAKTGLIKDIADLEGLVGDKKVSEQITDVTNPLAGRVTTLEGKMTTAEGKIATAEGKIATLETEIAKKANDEDLAAIAKTGSTDDLVQGELVLVFDCGGAGVTAE